MGLREENHALDHDDLEIRLRRCRFFEWCIWLADVVEDLIRRCTFVFLASLWVRMVERDFVAGGDES